MRTASFRANVLRILGSASLAGISVPLACGGQSIETPSQGDAGRGGRGGSGGSGGSSGRSNGVGGGLLGGSGGSAGESRGGSGSGGAGTGGTGTSGTAGWGGSAFGGYPGAAGAPPVAGAPGLAGTGAGGSTPGCFTSGVGVCCGSTKCLSLEEARTLAGLPASDGEGGEGGSGEGACPPGGDALPSGLCFWYGPLIQESAGECCYDYTSGSCCGRPFVVAGESRLAPPSRRSDWQLADRGARTHIDAATQRELAREWLEDARLEHASIASFARFILQLLSVGAPAALVELAQSAVADETHHARLCFALASRYLESDVGPGPLDIGAGGEVPSLVDVTIEAVIGGCVGETLAALQAEAQLVGARDPAVRRTLEIIARDETRHAELAWRFVKWAIDQHGDGAREAARDAFARAERRLAAECPGQLGQVDVVAFRAHGRLTPKERVAAHRRAFREVIAPCRDALLGTPSAEARGADAALFTRS
jgi:hypothetical protein